jgi:hypothetical protein
MNANYQRVPTEFGPEKGFEEKAAAALLRAERQVQIRQRSRELLAA